MRPALALAGLTALLVALAPSAEGAGAARPRIALSVSPAQVTLVAPSSRRIRLRNDGAERVMVDVARRTVRGEAAAQTWLQLMPARVLLRSGESAILTLRVRPPGRAEPGDHHVLVLLRTRPLRGGRVNVQLRLGIRIKMVVPGRIERHLAFGGLRVHRRRDARFMFLPVANRGNVTVHLRGQVSASLIRRGRLLARLSPRSRSTLRPGARAVLALQYDGRVRGLVTAVVRIRIGSDIRVEHRYRVRL